MRFVGWGGGIVTDQSACGVGIAEYGLAGLCHAGRGRVVLGKLGVVVQEVGESGDGGCHIEFGAVVIIRGGGC